MQSYSEETDFAKHLELPNDMQPGIVHMDNKMSLTRLRTKLENWLQNMFNVIACIKYLSFWKGIDNMKIKRFHIIGTIIFCLVMYFSFLEMFPILAIKYRYS
jgi:hypothetical protein